MAGGKYYKRKSKATKQNKKLATKSYVNRVVHKNIEDKYYYLSPAVNIGTLTDNWTEINLCAPTQGDLITNRTGQQIQIKSIELRFVMRGGANELATDDAFNVIRIVMARWSGSTDTPLDDLNTGFSDPINMSLKSGGRLIKKYYDKYVTFTVTSTEKGGGDGYSPTVRQIKYFKRFKNPIKITYGDNGVTMPTSRFILSCIGDSAVATSPMVYCGYTMATFEDA